ncbi:sigma-70 family RNA polymerase sigma factor [Actinoplanes friuliensis]|uniref:sigma-70 family RNA polymerase sigma factor n=1 Tax=Actinoplanes friuliensis TaxID=196914 RepID=UPI00040CE7FC|nr:sigma-70 family RNA polymerase sigma factor [Actinoplanes friuliensis]
MSAPVLENSGTVFRAREQRLRVVYDANAGALLRYLRRLTYDQPESAEDLLQETMLRAWRKVDELPSGAESVRRWLFTVARNLTIDAVRARLARPSEFDWDDLTQFPMADDTLDRALTRRTVDDALRRLTPEHRAVLVHLYYRDAPVSEVAADMGVPHGTIRSRAFYALRTVREFLERDDTP